MIRVPHSVAFRLDVILPLKLGFVGVVDGLIFAIVSDFSPLVPRVELSNALSLFDSGRGQYSRGKFVRGHTLAYARIFGIARAYLVGSLLCSYCLLCILVLCLGD